MLKTLSVRICSSSLFSQEKFDENGDKHVVHTHYKHIVLSAFLVLFCALALMALTNPRYGTARSLLDKGLTTTATVDGVDVKKLFGKGEKFITTVSYHFRVDGETFRGTSSKNSVQPELVAEGGAIEVLFDPEEPSVNGWRSALTRETSGMFGVIGAAALLLPYLSLSVYRYARWLRRRRRSRLAKKQNGLVLD